MTPKSVSTILALDAYELYSKDPVAYMYVWAGGTLLCSIVLLGIAYLYYEYKDWKDD